MYQKELFANYELDDSRWKRVLLTMLAASLALHLFVALTALFVPAVRDALHLASIFSDASERVFIDKDYLQTDIEDATIIDLTPGNFEYPAGYFQLANGDAPAPDFVAMTTTPQPEIVGYDSTVAASNNAPLFGFDQTAPTPVPTPFPLPTPYSNISIPPYVNTPPARASSRLPKLPKPKRGARLDDLGVVNGTETAKAEPTPDKTETAKVEPSPKPSPAVSPTPANPASGFEINKKPLEDFVKTIKERVVVKKDINLNADFAVNMEGEFDKDGKIRKLNIVNKSGDEEMIKVASQMLGAVNDSGWLKLLEDVYKGGNGKVLFSVLQDKDKVMFVIQSNRENEQKANSLSSNLNLALQGGALFVKGADEMTIFKSTSVQPNGKQVVIKLDMPRAVAQEMINRKLTEVKPEVPATNQPANPNAQAVK